MAKKEGFSEKVVVLLVVIAILLAAFSITFRVLDLDGKVSTVSDDDQSDGGRVGVIVLPPVVEDRGADEEASPDEA